MDNTQFVFEKQRWFVSPGQLCSSAREIARRRDLDGDLTTELAVVQIGRKRYVRGAAWLDLLSEIEAEQGGRRE